MKRLLFLTVIFSNFDSQGDAKNPKLFQYILYVLYMYCIFYRETLSVLVSW